MAPVFADDLVKCMVADGGRIEATVSGAVRASLDVWPEAAIPGPIRGDRLGERVVDLGVPIGGYGLRAGDDLAVYGDDGIVHPSAWPVIGNRLTIEHFVTGPWIHVRSIVQHIGAVPLGSIAHVGTALVDRFDTRAGERVVLDVRVSVEGRPVAAIEHESIIKLA